MPLRDPRIAPIRDRRDDEHDDHRYDGYGNEREVRGEGKHIGDRFHRDSFLFQIDTPPYSADDHQDHINYYGNDTGLHARGMNPDGYPYGNSPYPKNDNFQQRLFGTSDVPVPDEWNEWGVQEFKSKYPPGKKENKPWYASHIYGRLDPSGHDRFGDTLGKGGMDSIDRWWKVSDLIGHGLMDELQKPGGDDSMSDEAWQRKKAKKALYMQKQTRPDGTETDVAELYGAKGGLPSQMDRDDPELFETLGLSPGDDPQYELGKPSAKKSATKKFATKQKKAEEEYAKKGVTGINDMLASALGLGKKKKG